MRAWASPEQAEASGQKANAENDGGQLKLRKRELLLFLPDIYNRGDDASEQAH